MTGDDREDAFELFDEVPAYLTLVEGPELRITKINRRVREQPAGAQSLGRPAREIYPGDNPVIETLERVYASGIAETIHGVPPYFRDGAHADRYFTRHFTPLRDEHGKVDRVLVLAYEVTEGVRALHAQKESERRSQAEQQRLFSILEEVPMLVIVLEGPELRIVMLNRVTRALLGRRSVDGAVLGDVLPEGNSTLAAARRVHATGVPETFEVLARDVEGFAGRVFSSTVIPIRDSNGTVTRVMVASHDVTEERRTREALESQACDLEAARREAVEANRAKDEFLAMLSHELRNPLAPMSTTLGVMRLQGVSSPEVDVLDRQVRQLTRLVDDLLDVARIARGSVKLERADVDLRTVVTRALEMTGPLIEQRLHQVVTDLWPVWVNGDASRLAQVAANLITNAAKYSSLGAHIRIRTHRSGSMARLVVSDEGIGISRDMIECVFDPFVQEPQMPARSHGGLGLGLSIVKSLVDAHGGTVTAHSEGPGKGSTFVVELPAIDVPSAGREIPDRKLDLHPPARPLRVLVVDDNYDAAAALQGALEVLGHEVAVAHDGPSALARAASFDPQLGLLDIGLAGMDGYELAVALRAVRPVRLVAISGYGQERDRQRSRKSGFESHLVKPVDLEALIELLDRIGGGPIGE